MQQIELEVGQIRRYTNNKLHVSITYKILAINNTKVNIYII